MTWAEARLVPFALPLSRPLETAHGTWHERRGWLVRLLDRDGLEGHATAMPIAGFGGETFEACGAALERVLDLEAAGTFAADALDGAPFAASAWHTAQADLNARREKQPLAADLVRRVHGPGTAPRAEVAVNALIAAETPDALRAGVEAARAYPVIKLKVGADVDAALERIEVACDVLASGQRLRVDPNSSWSEADAARALAALADRPIEYVEQPTPGLDALARLRRSTRVALAADESVSDAEGFTRAVRDRSVDVVVMKPMCIGGVDRAVALGDTAQSAEVDVVVTSLLDSVIGVRAAQAVALALSKPPLACGLATANLFERDLVRVASPPSSGALRGWTEPGLGTEIDDAALTACALADERRFVGAGRA